MQHTVHIRSRGFSLIEMLIVIGITTLVVLAIAVSIQYVYRGQRFTLEQADATRSARTGIEGVVEDMREATYADNGAYPIISMGTSTVSFYSDIDNDNSRERVRYFLDGDEFKQGITEATSTPAQYNDGDEVVATISTHVRNGALSVPLFTYYDIDGSEMSEFSDIDAVAFVLVRLVVNLEPSRAPNDFELRASAALRNIK